MQGTTCCFWHTTLQDRAVLAERQIEKHSMNIARLASPSIKNRSAETIRSAQRTLLFKAWRDDPSIPGKVLTLSDADEETLVQWLKSRDINLVDHLPGTIEHLRRAARRAITGMSPPATVARIITRALRHEERWRTKNTPQA